MRKFIQRYQAYGHLPLAIILRGIGVLLQFGLQLVVARMAGPAGISVLQIYLSWTCISGEAAAVGLPLKLMKLTAREGQTARTKALLIRSIKTVCQLWLVMLLVVVLIRLMPQPWLRIEWSFLFAAAWSTLCFALLRIFAELLKALNRPNFGIFAETSIVPAGVILLCLIAQSYQLTAVNNLYLVVTSTVWLSVSCTLCLRKCWSLLKNCQPAATDDQNITLFDPETTYFWMSSMLAIGFLIYPFFLMPLFDDMAEVGRFTVAFKLINTVSTILIMLAAFFAPRFSRASAAHNTQELKRLLFKSQLVSLALYLPILLPVLLFREQILSVFGADFGGAEFYIIVLALAQFVNAGTGLAGNLLNMIGAGRRELQISIVFFSSAGLSSLLLGANLNTEGLAVIYAIAIGGKALCSYIAAWLYLRQMPSTTHTLPTEGAVKCVP